MSAGLKLITITMTVHEDYIDDALNALQDVENEYSEYTHIVVTDDTGPSDDTD